MKRLHRMLLLCSLLASIGAGDSRADPAVSARPAEHVQSLESIRHAAAELVRGELGGSASRAILTPAALDPRLRLVKCPTALEAALPKGVEVRAAVTVTVQCPATGWIVYVPVSVEVELPVLILQHPVPAGAHVAALDVIAQTRRVAGVFSQFIPSASALAGLHARRPLMAGSVLVADMMAADPIVVHGQQVTLVASLGGLEVRAPGRVLNDGALAARVQVQNLSSQRIVEGVVETADTVRVTP